MSLARQQLLVALAIAGISAMLAVVIVGRDDAPRGLSEGHVVVGDVLRRDVTRVDVRGPQGSWSAERAATGEWWLRRGERQAPADPLALHDLLDAVEEAQRGVEVAPPSTLAYGFESPVRLTVWRGGEPWELEVGDEAPVGGRTYVRRPGGPVVAVRGRLGEAARRPAADYLLPDDTDPR